MTDAYTLSLKYRVEELCGAICHLVSPRSDYYKRFAFMPILYVVYMEMTGGENDIEVVYDIDHIMILRLDGNLLKPQAMCEMIAAEVKKKVLDMKTMTPPASAKELSAMVTQMIRWDGFLKNKTLVLRPLEISNDVQKIMTMTIALAVANKSKPGTHILMDEERALTLSLNAYFTAKLLGLNMREMIIPRLKAIWWIIEEEAKQPVAVLAQPQDEM